MSLRLKIFHLLLSFRQIQFHFMLQLFNFEDILNLTFARYLMLFEFLEFAERSNFAEKVYSQLFAFHKSQKGRGEPNSGRLISKVINAQNKCLYTTILGRYWREKVGHPKSQDWALLAFSCVQRWDQMQENKPVSEIKFYKGIEVT